MDILAIKTEILTASVFTLQNVVTFGLAAAITGIIALFIDARQSTKSWGEALTLVGLELKAFGQTLRAVFDDFIAYILEVAGKIPVIGTAFKKAAAFFRDGSKEATDGAAQLINKMNELQTVAATVSKNVKDVGIDPKASAEIETLKVKYKDFGKTQLEIIKSNRDEQLKALQDIAKAEPKLRNDVAELALKIELEYAKRTADEKKRINKELQDELEKQEKKRLDEIQKYANLATSAISAINAAAPTKDKSAPDDLSEQQKKFFDEEQKRQDEFLKKQAAGAALVGAAASTAIAAAIPGLGAILGPIVDQVIQLFAKGKEFVISAVNALVSSLPDILLNILDVFQNINVILINAAIAFVVSLSNSIDRIIETAIFGTIEAFLNLLNKMPELIDVLVGLIPRVMDRLVEIAPRLIQKLADESGPIIAALVAKMPEVAIALAVQMPVVAIAFSESILANIPKIVSGLGLALKNAMIDAAKAFVDGIANAGGNIIDGIVSIIPGVPHATGGEVPKGFNKDNYPARLTSGELIVPKDTTNALKNFLDNGGSGDTKMFSAMIGLLEKIESKMGSEDIVVNVGGKQLISTIRENIKSGRVLA